MSAIFTTAPGTLVAIQTSNAPTAALIKVQGVSEVQNIIVTSLRVQAQTAYQVSSTIGGPQYLFPFGDRLQEISLGLLVVPLACQDSSDGQVSAFSRLWKFYYDKRISPSKIQAVKITFAGQTISGLVTSLQASAEPQEGVPLIQCQITLLGWAESTEEQAASAAAENSEQAAGSSEPLVDPATENLGMRLDNLNDAVDRMAENPNASPQDMSAIRAQRDSVRNQWHKSYERSKVAVAKGR